MFSAVMLTALCVPTLQGDPPRTTVPEAADVAGDEHPVVAAVSKTLKADGGKSDRPFMLVVSIQSSKPKQVIAAFKTPLVETRKEEGNIMYLLSQDADEPEKFLLVERWKSLDALKEHFEQPYLVELLKELEPVATIELRVLKAVRAGNRSKKKKAQ